MEQITLTTLLTAILGSSFLAGAIGAAITGYFAYRSKKVEVDVKKVEVDVSGEAKFRDQLLEDIKNLRERLDKMENSLANAKQRETELLKQNLKLERDVERLTEENTRLKSKLDALQQQYAELEKRLDERN